MSNTLHAQKWYGYLFIARKQMPVKYNITILFIYYILFHLPLITTNIGAGLL